MHFQFHSQQNDLCFGCLIAAMFSIMATGIIAGFQDLDQWSGIDSVKVASFDPGPLETRPS